MRQVLQPDSLIFEAVLEELSSSPLEREYQFHPERKFRFDYAWPEKKIALEVEGGLWRKGGGAHSHPKGILRDIEKYNLATTLGWRVIRVTSHKPEKIDGWLVGWLDKELNAP